MDLAEVHQSAQGSGIMDALLADTNSWNSLIARNAEVQEPPVFVPAAAARRSLKPVSISTAPKSVIKRNDRQNNSGEPISSLWTAAQMYQKDMFLIFARPVRPCIFLTRLFSFVSGA